MSAPGLRSRNQLRKPSTFDGSCVGINDSRFNSKFLRAVDADRDSGKPLPAQSEVSAAAMPVSCNALSPSQEVIDMTYIHDSIDPNDASWDSGLNVLQNTQTPISPCYPDSHNAMCPAAALLSATSPQSPLTSKSLEQAFNFLPGHPAYAPSPPVDFESSCNTDSDVTEIRTYCPSGLLR